MDIRAGKNTSTRDYIYKKLLDDILNFRLKPGTTISEKEISELYEVSRTPVREAFIQLQKEELLNIYPQRGSVVSLIDTSLVEEARFMREQLELAVIKLACEEFSTEDLLNLEMNLKQQEICLHANLTEKNFKLDEEFHYIIFKGCQKGRIWESIQTMNLHFKRQRVLRLVDDLNWTHIYNDHKSLYQAIADKDAETGQRVMHRHLTRVWDDSEHLKKRYPEYFTK